MTTCRTATTLRAVSEQDDCEALLEEPDVAEVEEEYDDTPETVPAWSTPLRQPKLSEDPVIRMLSGSWSKTTLALGGEGIINDSARGRQTMSIGGARAQSHEAVAGPASAILVRSGTTQTNDTAPTLPERAEGHVGPPIPFQNDSVTSGLLSTFPRPPPLAVVPVATQVASQPQLLTFSKRKQANGSRPGDENIYRGVKRGRGLSSRGRETGQRDAGKDWRRQVRDKRWTPKNDGGGGEGLASAVSGGWSVWTGAGNSVSGSGSGRSWYKGDAMYTRSQTGATTPAAMAGDVLGRTGNKLPR